GDSGTGRGETWRFDTTHAGSLSDLDPIEQQLLAQWRQWQHSSADRPQWAESLRAQFAGRNRVRGMLLGGAVAEAHALGWQGAGQRASSALFALDGMVRARAEGLEDPLHYALDGLQQW